MEIIWHLFSFLFFLSFPLFMMPIFLETKQSSSDRSPLTEAASEKSKNPIVRLSLFHFPLILIMGLLTVPFILRSLAWNHGNHRE